MKTNATSRSLRADMTTSDERPILAQILHRMRPDKWFFSRHTNQEPRPPHNHLFFADTLYNVPHIPASPAKTVAAEPKGSRMHMAPEKAAVTQEQSLVRFGLKLANWSERWFPDPLIFALIGIVVVFVVGLLLHQPASKLAVQGGKNFWALVPFTMQMVMIIIGGYVVASTPIVYRAIQALAGIPKTPRGAVAMIALFSMLTSLISWGLSLIFSGLFVRELAHRVKGLDYRAAGGAAYLGLGAVWAMGLSSSAAMLMATKSAMPPALFNISGLIPLTQTLFLWQSIATTVILIVLSVLIAYLSTPSPENARTAESYGIQYEPIRSSLNLEERSKPGEWLEYSPLLTLLVAALLCWYLVDVFRTSPQGALAALDLNTYNLIFITVG